MWPGARATHLQGWLDPVENNAIEVVYMKSDRLEIGVHNSHELELVSLHQ